MIRCIAIDDEPVALAVLRAHSEKVDFIKLEATFLSVTKAMGYIQENHVDLIFLDINMPLVSGIELAGMLPGKVRVVFTTAYPEYAVKGFDLAAVDYLLKPFGYGRFLTACLKAQEALKEEGGGAGEVLLVKDGYDWVRIGLDQILYVEACDNYLAIHEKSRTTLTRMTMAGLVQKLPEKAFLRVHKSYAVALNKIRKIERHQVVIEQREVPVSLRYREKLIRTIQGAGITF